MENTFDRLEDLAHDLKEYVNTRTELGKVMVVEKSSQVMANLLARIVVILGIFLFMIFLGISLAYLAAGWTGQLWLGFLIMACVYLLIVLIVWYFRNKLFRNPIMDSMIQQLYKDDEKDH